MEFSEEEICRLRRQIEYKSEKQDIQKSNICFLSIFGLLIITVFFFTHSNVSHVTSLENTPNFDRMLLKGIEEIKTQNGIPSWLKDAKYILFLDFINTYKKMENTCKEFELELDVIHKLILNSTEITRIKEEDAKDKSKLIEGKNSLNMSWVHELDRNFSEIKLLSLKIEGTSSCENYSISIYKQHDTSDDSTVMTDLHNIALFSLSEKKNTSCLFIPNSGFYIFHSRDVDSSQNKVFIDHYFLFNKDPNEMKETSKHERKTFDLTPTCSKNLISVTAQEFTKTIRINLILQNKTICDALPQTEKLIIFN